MPEDLTSVNAEQVSAEGSQETVVEQNTDTGEQAAEVAAPQAKVEQTPEENAKFAALRREYETRQQQAVQEAADKQIERIYGEQGIHTVAEYEAAIEAQRVREEAEKQGIDPEIYEQMSAAQRDAAEAKRIAEQATTQLFTYQRREELAHESEVLAADPKLGQFFTDNKAEIMRVAAEIDGSNLTPQQHLDMATTFVLRDKWQPVDEKAIKEAGVKEYLTALKKQNVPVEGRGGAIPSIMQTQNSKDPWKNATRSALDMIRAEKL